MKDREPILKDRVLRVHYLNRDKAPCVKEYPLTEKQRYFIHDRRMSAGIDYLGGDSYAETFRIRAACSPPDGDTDSVLNWLVLGEKSGSFKIENPYQFLGPDRKENWHIKDYVPTPLTGEQMDETARQILAGVRNKKNHS